MKVLNPKTGNLEEVYLQPGGDTLPIGTIVDVQDDVEIPYGYELVSNTKVSKFNFGKLPNASSKTLTTNIPSTATITGLKGLAINSGKTVLCLPHISVTNSMASLSLWVSNNVYVIEIKTTTDLSSYSAVVTIEYEEA